MIRICHLTSVHNRYDVRIFYKECSSLKEDGFDVYLIVADGKGYEIKDGIKILDVGKRKSKFRRIILSTNDIYKKAKSLNATIYHFHDPELIWVGLKLRIRKKQVIYDIHEDYYKQIFLKHQFFFPVKWIIAKIYRLTEKTIFHFFSALIVPQPSMVKNYNNCNRKVTLICNFVKTRYDVSTFQNHEKPFIYHGGGLSEERGLINMIRAMEFVKGDIDLFIAGLLPTNIINEMKKLKGWNKVKYLGLLSYEESRSYYENCALGLILYNNIGQYYLSYSIKLFEYMSYGKAILMPDFGEWVEFNLENKCGINVDVRDHFSVAKKIDILMKNEALRYELGSNGIRSVHEKYNWSIEAKKLVNLYNDLQRKN